MKLLTDKEILLNKEKIEGLLKSTEREGMEAVLRYLDEVSFFTVPSSTHRHHNWRGSLAQHCLGVYEFAQQIDDSLPRNSVIIAGLLHDLCKAGKYYYDEAGELHRRHPHIKGHGRRSLILLEKCGLVLTPEERRAIRWHMGGYHTWNEEDKKDVALARTERLWYVVHKADQYNASRNN